MVHKAPAESKLYQEYWSCVNQGIFPNRVIKSEPVSTDLELETLSAYKSTDSLKNTIENNVVLKQEGEQSSISRSELIIKSENLGASKSHQGIFSNRAIKSEPVTTDLELETASAYKSTDSSSVQSSISCSELIIKSENLVASKSHQEIFSNSAIKSEPVPTDLELETASAYKSIDSLKQEGEQSSTSCSELIIIKSANLGASISHEDVNKSTESKINFLSCNLDSSSLDVNLSSKDTDFEDVLSQQSTEDVTPNISINNTAEPSKYFSIIEISSVENDELPVQDSQLKEIIISPKKPHQKKIPNLRNQGERTTQSKFYFKTVGRNRKTKKRQSNKYTEKDSAYIRTISKRNLSKNLHKTSIKTRKKVNKPNVEKTKKTLKNVSKTNIKTVKKINKPIIEKTTTSTKDDFPRPFKFEPSTLQQERSVAIELPKPMMLKSELELNTKNRKSFLKPKFQPFVRLKRIKTAELLVPLKTTHVRNNRKFESTTNIYKRFNYHQMTNDNSSDFLIQRAYSLNTCTKFNPLTIDHDHYYCNQQSSLNNRLTASCSRLTNTPNESLTETKSKYFSPQELYSLFHSSTPNSSSLLSSPIDSGVYTSTPSTSHHSSEHNKTLLLKIAAERAFINNHLMHFGYSPIQFDLYNNLNDLNVFLKYLFGNVNTN